MELRTEEKAPDFTLPDQSGEEVSLSDFHGMWVLLYFYPKDDTPGCTKEACALRDEFPEFEKLDAIVLGVSPDAPESHRKFSKKHKLPFRLLADEAHEVCELYGAWGEKSLHGKTYEGVLRTSFLIDPDGVIVKIYEQVKPERHAEEVLSDLREAQSLS